MRQGSIPERFQAVLIDLAENVAVNGGSELPHCEVSRAWIVVRIGNRQRLRQQPEVTRLPQDRVALGLFNEVMNAVIAIR